ncbi:MAG: nucleotidyltransferase family protein [Pseudomonadota bacterium]
MRDTPDAVMIYAAGFGTRMRPLTDHMPKPLIEVAGKPLIEHALELVRDVKPARVAVNLHYRAAQLAAYLEGSEVTPLIETPDILDMGGGLRAAADVLGTAPVWTINPDVLWRGPNPLRVAANAWQPERMDALLVCVPMAQTRARAGAGDFTIAADGQLRQGPDCVYGGVQIIKMDRLLKEPVGPFPIQPLWAEMAAAGRLHGTLYPGTWCDVGTPDGIAVAEEMLQGV